MNHPETAPARVGAGEGPIKSELRAESATAASPGQADKPAAFAGAVSKKSSAIEAEVTPFGNGLGKKSNIKFIEDDAKDEGWSFSIPIRKGKGTIRIPTWEELTRRNNRTISESDKAAMRTNDNFDDDWKCITIPPEGAGHNKGLVLAMWQILAIFERTPEEAVAHLTTVYKRDPSDVRQALNTVQKGAAGGGAAAGGTTRKKKVEFPKANMDAIAKAGRCSLEELKSSSPCQEGLDFSPLDALKHLMRKAEAENPLVCVGLNKREFQTLPIDGVAKEILEGWSYLVPSAMSALEGTKVDGSGQSAKTNDNTGPRLNLVFEGDGITKKQQAGVIRFLSAYVPISCAVDSGGKSIHAFVDVAGRSPEDHLRLMKIFCRLGGDSAMWTLSQFARMPGGMRRNDDGSETKQEILYLDLDPPDLWRLNELEAAMAGAESDETEAETPDAPRSMIVRGVNSFPTTFPPESVLVGRGWMRRHDIINLVSSAGGGKTVAATQKAMAWGLGLPYFGLKPPRPLRVLLFSGEDDQVTIGQCREGFLEHSEAITGRKLTTADLAPLDHMMRTEFIREHVGSDFHTHLNQLLTDEPADMVIINPLLSYIGGEIVACASTWLRGGLMPILQKHDCAALIVHHTPKLMKNSWENMDDTYSAIGGGEIANVPRSILTLKPTPASGLFVLTVSKRQTTGWKDGDGKFATSYFVKRSDNPERPAWIPVSWNEASVMIGVSRGTQSGPARKKVVIDDVVEALDVSGGMSRQNLIQRLMETCRCSDKPARDAIKAAEGSEAIVSFTKTNPNGGNDLKWFRLPDDSSIG